MISASSIITSSSFTSYFTAIDHRRFHDDDFNIYYICSSKNFSRVTRSSIITHCQRRHFTSRPAQSSPSSSQLSLIIHTPAVIYHQHVVRRHTTRHWDDTPMRRNTAARRRTITNSATKRQVVDIHVAWRASHYRHTHIARLRHAIRRTRVNKSINTNRYQHTHSRISPMSAPHDYASGYYYLHFTRHYAGRASRQAGRRCHLRRAALVSQGFPTFSSASLTYDRNSALPPRLMPRERVRLHDGYGLFDTRCMPREVRTRLIRAY